MALRSLAKVPPLGSVKDRFLREVFYREREIEFHRASIDLVVNRGKTKEAAEDNRLALDRFKRLTRLYFPSVKKDDEVEQKKTQGLMGAMEKFLAKNASRSWLGEGPEKEVQGHAAMRRPSLFDIAKETQQ